MYRTVNEYANLALDRSYKRKMKPVLDRLWNLSTAPDSRMYQATQELRQEALKLSENEKPISSTNITLKKALVAFGAVLNASASLIRGATPELEEDAHAISSMSVTAKVFLRFTGKMLSAGVDPLTTQAQAQLKKTIARTGAKWVIPKSLDFAKMYTETTQWQNKMRRWASGYEDYVTKAILQGIQDGNSPKLIAEKVAEFSQNIPYYAAENLTRTLQLTAYREASQAMELINGEFILGKIRIAELDMNTCLSCIALHGSQLAPGERIDDHYRGRCTEYYQVPGGDPYPPFMQADSVSGNRNFVPFQTGTDWFASLPPERQVMQASFQSSPGKFEAYRKGAAMLEDFVKDHTDPLFGHMYVENSLKGMGIR